MRKLASRKGMRDSWVLVAAGTLRWVSFTCLAPGRLQVSQLYERRLVKRTVLSRCSLAPALAPGDLLEIPAGLCRRCTGVAVPLRVVPSPTGLPSKRGPGLAHTHTHTRARAHTHTRTHAHPPYLSPRGDQRSRLRHE